LPYGLRASDRAPRSAQRDPATHGHVELLGVVTINMADNLLHVAIATISLFLGFAPRHGAPVAVRYTR
jgi:hypothetical protein